MPSPKPPKPAVPRIASIYQIKVTLTGTRPPIWRRLLVPADLTLARLHNVLQIAFGWYDCHTHEFRVGRETYGPPDFADFDLPETVNERKTPIGAVLRRIGAKAVYTYDFGDSWRHSIAVEKILPPDPALKYPLCTAGKLQRPPEDCGGVPGFYNFLEIMADTKHPEHKEMREWFGGNFDPSAFSMDEINAQLGGLRRARK